MDKAKLKWIIRLIYTIVMILTVLHFIPYLEYFMNNTSQYNILDFGPTIDLMLESLYIAIRFALIILICEFGVYSSIKYFLTEPEKNKIELSWHIIKLVVALVVIWERFERYAQFVRQMYRG
ncbi:MAG: hypothetical protein E7468_06295 [Ruminococcaceae bacterium]|nr:hypothetical protein [Oscillospiraceae bacterium]